MFVLPDPEMYLFRWKIGPLLPIGNPTRSLSVCILTPGRARRREGLKPIAWRRAAFPRPTA